MTALPTTRPGPTRVSRPTDVLVRTRRPVRTAYQPTDLRAQRVAARKRAGGLALLGAFLVAIGSLLPWATSLGGTVFGTEGDGDLTLGVAVLVAVIAVVASQGGGRTWMCVAALALGVGATAIGAYNLSELGIPAAVPVDPGPGLPVLLTGAVLVVGSAFYGLVWGAGERRRPTTWGAGARR